MDISFGSIYGMIVEANLVRSNASEVYNPWAFLEHFSRTFMILYFIALALYLNAIKEGTPKFWKFVFLILTLLGSLIVMLCTDSRGDIGIIIIVTVLYYFFIHKSNIKKNIKTSLWTVFLLMCVAFIFIIMSDVIMNNIRQIEVDTQQETMIEIIIKEFGFTFASQQNAIRHVESDPFSFLIYNDFINAIFRWIPSRFIPFEMPQNIWDFNTESLQKYNTFYGQAPSDFISTSLYSFGFLGFIIQPMYFGILLKKIETTFRKRTNAVFHNAIYGYFFFFSIWWVGFYSLATTILSLFGTFFLFILVKYTSK